MFRYYLRLGLLSIRANPALSALMVAAIAIGIGACMTIVTIHYIMSGNPIPEKSDQLFHVRVDSWDPNEAYDEPNEPPEQLTYLDATALYAAGRAARQVISFLSSRVIEPEDEGAKPFQRETRATTHEFFTMFNVPFKYGAPWDRTADETLERVVVINDKLNQTLFGGADSSGRMLMLTGEPYRIVGVLDEWSPVPLFYDLNNGEYGDPAPVFLPFSVAVAGEHGRWGNTNCWKPIGDGGMPAFLASECVWIQMWAELHSDAERQSYLQFLDAYVSEQKTLGRFPRAMNNRLDDVQAWLTYNEVVDDDVGVLLGLALLFLVVCLLNTIGLLLAKVMRRAKDISLRRALGASKATLFGQYIVEAGMIGLAGGLLGILMTWLGLRGIENLFSAYDFVAKLVRMDWVMVLTAVLLAILSALAAALYPTWRASNVTPATQLRIQ
ncbi:MAG: ABC transporter permease [Gammaproteobacteria bacterium]|nr:ABC transporter permease [Gammaproteobacteria bacterium]MDH5302487.1 ABC transporter permease [Gammaproteobacteria bacterium]MDH5321369.1 ABC transporter permease [Gammaproteobacteria bacterium]